MPPIKNRSVDPSFNNLYAKFESYSTTYKYSIPQNQEDNLIIQFGTLGTKSSNGMEVGICETGPVGLNGSEAYKVTVDTNFWNSADDYTRESLLFHELGHCLLNRLHKNDKTVIGTPVSIMNAILVRGDVYNYNQSTYDDFVKELFTGEY